MKRSLILPITLGLFAPFIAFAKPNISPVSPTTAAAGVAVNLTATVSSAVPIERCSLWVDLAEVGNMTVIGGTASYPFTFQSGGSRIAFVFCRDTSGGMAAGATTAIEVSGTIQVSPPLSNPNPPPPPPPSPTTTIPITTVSPDAGKLLKLTCPAEAAVDHPCKAVYYITADGKRHAFPNSRVFFTWYANFDSVEEVTAERLSQFALGPNITYRAGVRMVKFTTDPKVYAVARGSVLRWVKTEELAVALYGTDWNTKIDDISDVFYTNYLFGAEINSITEYSPSFELEHSRD